MAIIDKVNVLTGVGVILWDGITQPDKNEDGTVKNWSLKVAFPQQQAEVAELNYVAGEELKAGEFKGVMPTNGLPAISLADPTLLPNHVTINPKSYRSAPEVFDANGKPMQPMQYGNMLYPGCKVKVIVACRTYNNKSKGLGWWLNGIQIVDATAPKLDIGTGGPDAGAIFAAASGGMPPVMQPTAPPVYAPNPVALQPAYAPPVAPAHDFLTPPVPGMAVPPAPPVPAGPQMTAAAGGASYAAMKAAGWTDELLRQHGMMI